MIIDTMFGVLFGIPFMVHEKETKRLLIADAYGTPALKHTPNTFTAREYATEEQKMKNEKNYIKNPYCNITVSKE